jgi:hypothetical protein
MNFIHDDGGDGINNYINKLLWDVICDIASSNEFHEEWFGFVWIILMKLFYLVKGFFF